MKGGKEFMKYAFLFLMFLSISRAAFSQESEKRPSPDVALIIGTSAFLDEEIPFDHFVIGGSMRFYLSKRLSAGPQFLYMNGPDSDRDYSVVGNVAYDLITNKKFVLYAVGGAGILNHSERIGNTTFSDSEGTASGGIGAKLFVTERLFLAPEFRLGWEPLLSASIGIGYSF
jgi:Outer membrane protein beta-barrel domain